MGHHAGESLGVHYVVVGRSCYELTKIKEGLVILFATLLLEVASIPIKSVLLEFFLTDLIFLSRSSTYFIFLFSFSSFAFKSFSSAYLFGLSDIQ